MEGGDVVAAGVGVGVGGGVVTGGEVVLDDVEGCIVVNQLGTGTG